MKRLQNKIAESRMTLSFVSVLGFLICIACGAIGMQLGNTVFSNVAWWEQVLILAVSTMRTGTDSRRVHDAYGRAEQC